MKRGSMRRTALLLIFVIVFIISFGSVSAMTYPPVYVQGADAYVLMDAKSGQVLASYQADKQLYPASTTKMLTAVVALENASLDTRMTASAAAVHDIGKDGMNIGIQAGEIIRMEDLLHALLIVSANETANIIAENVCDTRESFMELCNEKAKQIGMVNTHFTNPSGMHDDNHYTTAMDLGMLAQYALKNETFRTIVKKTSLKMPPTNKHATWNTLYTSNILLRANNFNGYEITGIKSGYTDPAGRCLISSARNNDGEELILVIMGIRAGNSAEVLTEVSTKLFEYGFKNFQTVNVVRSNVFLGLHSMEKARDQAPLVLVAQADLDVFTLASVDKEKIQTKLNIDQELELPIKENDVVGTADFYYKDQLLGSVNIAAGNNVYADLSGKKDKGDEKHSAGDLSENAHPGDVDASEEDQDNILHTVIRIGKIVLIVLASLSVLYALLTITVNIKKRKKYKNIRRNNNNTRT